MNKAGLGAEKRRKEKEETEKASAAEDFLRALEAHRRQPEHKGDARSLLYTAWHNNFLGRYELQLNGLLSPNVVEKIRQRKKLDIERDTENNLLAAAEQAAKLILK